MAVVLVVCFYVIFCCCWYSGSSCICIFLFCFSALCRLVFFVRVVVYISFRCSCFVTDVFILGFLLSIGFVLSPYCSIGFCHCVCVVVLLVVPRLVGLMLVVVPCHLPPMYDSKSHMKGFSLCSSIQWSQCDFHFKSPINFFNSKLPKKRCCCCWYCDHNLWKPIWLLYFMYWMLHRET